jgi:hypothetical protein
MRVGAPRLVRPGKKIATPGKGVAWQRDYPFRQRPPLEQPLEQQKSTCKCAKDRHFKGISGLDEPNHAERR